MVKNNEKYYIIEVPEHMSFLTHGSARICLDKELYRYYKVYLHKMRNIVLSKCGQYLEKHFFVSWTGKAMQSNEVNKGLKTIWREAGLRSNIGSSLIRRTVTTNTYQNEDTEGCDLIARLHCHNPNTAQMHYRASMSFEETMEASTRVAKIFCRRQENDNSEAEEEVDDLPMQEDIQISQEESLNNDDDHRYTDIEEEGQDEDSKEGEKEQQENDEGGKAQQDQQEGKDKHQEKLKIVTTHEEELKISTVPPDWKEYLLKLHERGRSAFTANERELILTAFSKSVLEKKLPTLGIIRDVI